MIDALAGLGWATVIVLVFAAGVAFGWASLLYLEGKDWIRFGRPKRKEIVTP